MQEIINFYSDYFQQQGANPLLGQIFGILIMETEPLCLTEIAERLSFSKPAISVQIRLLNQMGYCKKIPRGSDRKDYYIINENHIDASYKNVIRKQLFFAEELSRIIKHNEKELSTEVNKRLDELKEFYSFISKKQEEIINDWKNKHPK